MSGVETVRRGETAPVSPFRQGEASDSPNAKPAGWRWKGSPAEYTRKDESVDYSYVAGQKKDVVFLEQNIVTHGSVVPVDQMSEHLTLRREISDIAHPNWVLVLPELEAGKRRDQRLNALIRDVMKENDARSKDKDR